MHKGGSVSASVHLGRPINLLQSGFAERGLGPANVHVTSRSRTSTAFFASTARGTGSSGRAPSRQRCAWADWSACCYSPGLDLLRVRGFVSHTLKSPPKSCVIALSHSAQPHHSRYACTGTGHALSDRCAWRPVIPSRATGFVHRPGAPSPAGRQHLRPDIRTEAHLKGQESGYHVSDIIHIEPVHPSRGAHAPRWIQQLRR